MNGGHFSHENDISVKKYVFGSASTNVLWIRNCTQNRQRAGRTLRAHAARLHSSGGSTFLREMTSRPPSPKYDVASKNTTLSLSIDTHLPEERSCLIFPDSI